MVGTIFWPTLCGGILIFVLMFWRTRDRIDPRTRSKIENIMLALAFIILLIDVIIAIDARADEGREINDCIAFYRYLPDFHVPENYSFFFLSKCDDYFSPSQIGTLKESGRAWARNKVNRGEINWSEVEISVVGN